MTITPQRQKLYTGASGMSDDSHAELPVTVVSQLKMSGQENNSTQPFRSPKPQDLEGEVFEGISDNGQDKLKCHIRKLLGQGGMGYVYRAENLAHQRALKILNFACLVDRETVDRFKRETYSTSKIKHINVIRILFQGTAQDGRPFFLMPLLDGQSLSELMRQRHKLPIIESLEIFIDICAGLAAAHKVNVIHRDIKPANIMILAGTTPDVEIRGGTEPLARTRDQAATDKLHKVVIVDFGIAKVLPESGDPTMKQTTTGNIFGTPLYMSPEQCLGRPIDNRSDIYAMGCLMYEILTGAPPFVGSQNLATMNMHVTEPPPRLTSLPGESSRMVEQLNSIILRCLQKDPAQRYQSITEVQDDLEAAKQSLQKPIPMAAIGNLKSALWLRFASFSQALFQESKRYAVPISLCTVILVIGIAMMPYMVAKDPPGSLTEIAWENVEPLPARTPEAFAVKKKQIFGLYNEEARSTQTPKGIPITPDAFTIMKDAGDLFFKNQKYKEALNLYKGAIDVGNFLVLKDIETQASNMGSACLSAAFCSLKIKDYRKAILYAKTGLEVAKKSSMRQDDQALFYGILSVSNIGLRNEPEAASNATVFMSYLDKSEFKPEESYDIAPLVSVIGDFYLTTGHLDKAASAYSKAQKAWNEFDDRGKYNEGVSDCRLGLVARERARSVQDLSAAADLFQKSFALFPNQGATSDGARARTKFYEASTYWQMKTWNGFLKALSVRKEAVDIWSELKKR
jgi:serine/threonine protein kinase